MIDKNDNDDYNDNGNSNSSNNSCSSNNDDNDVDYNNDNYYKNYEAYLSFYYIDSYKIHKWIYCRYCVCVELCCIVYMYVRACVHLSVCVSLASASVTRGWSCGAVGR